MLKITALNEVQSKETEEENVNAITKEAQEQFALNEYNRALQLLIENNKTEALSVLLELLDTKLLDEVEKPEKQDGHARPMLSLKYACYKNIANIQADLENYHEALNNYWQAINLDDTDVMIWYKIGMLALNKINLEESCFAFRQGLKCNPNHWPCLDRLITVLYAIPDYMNCLMYISLALERDPSYVKGLILYKEILKVVPSFDKLANDWLEFSLGREFDQSVGKGFLEEAKKLSEDWRVVCEADKADPLSHLNLKSPLESLSWIELGEKMMCTIKHMNENDLNLLSRIVLVDSEQLKKLVSDAKKTFNSKEHNGVGGENQLCPSEFKIREKVNGANESQLDSYDELNQVKVEANGCIEKLNSEDKDEEGIANEESKLNEKVNEHSLENGRANVKLNVRESQRQKKVKKRRRSSLCILTDWHWSSSNTKRSSRISNRKDCEKDGVEETLKRMFPPALLPDNIKFSKEDTAKNNDSMDTMDAYYAMLNKENNSTEDSKSRESFKANSPSIECRTSYFGLEQESIDVRDFIDKYSGKSNMITLTRKLIEFLCTKWNQKWPDELLELYIQLYLYVKKYTQESSPFSNDETDDFSLKLNAEVKLLYCELVLDKWLVERACAVAEEQRPKEKLETTGVATLSDDLGCVIFAGNDDDDDDDDDLSNAYLWRTLWLQANLFLYQGDVEVSLRIFQLLSRHINESQVVDFRVKLDNCKYNALISADAVEKAIRLIQRSKEFSKVRHLYEEKRYGEVSDILKDTFYFTKQINEFFGGHEDKRRIDRIEHFKLLLDCLWRLDQFEDCYVWAEACFNESWHSYLNTIGIEYLQSGEAGPQNGDGDGGGGGGDGEERKNWVDSILYTLKMLDDCVSEVSIFVVQYLKESHRSRLVKNLVHFVSHQLEIMDSTSTIPIFSVLPWILLHYVLQYEEDRGRARSMSSSRGSSSSSSRRRQQARSSDTSDMPSCSAAEADESADESSESNEIPASVVLLFKAHTFLGRHGWCCVDEGRLLLFIVKTIMPKLNFPLLAGIKAKLREPLEQVVFCLYGHPAKVSSGLKQRPKHLEEHHQHQQQQQQHHMALSWETCQILLEFYRPDSLPSYDAKRVDSIGADTLDLFKKMCIHVPKESASQETAKDMNAYLHGTYNNDQESGDVPPPRVRLPLTGPASYLYYFIADYYFKNLGAQSWAKAAKYYVYDLCQHADEFNSWAGLAMSTSTLMETWLNNFEPNISEERYLERAQVAQRAYQRAVELEPSHLTIWTEYGNFLYFVHSYCSRLLKQESDSLNMRRFELLESQRDEMLSKAKDCFSSADRIYNSCQGLDEPQDERWLYQYMLGKIAEKRAEEPTPATFLRHYLQAGERLAENNAQHPRRVSHSNPPALAIEALEVYYRVFASVLKYLEQHHLGSGKPLKKSLAGMLLASLSKCLRLPFVSYDCIFYKVPADQLVLASSNTNSNSNRRGSSQQSTGQCQDQCQANSRKSSSTPLPLPLPLPSTNTSLKKRPPSANANDEDRHKKARLCSSEADLKKDVGSVVDELIMKVCQQLSASSECPVIKFAPSCSSAADTNRMDVDVDVNGKRSQAQEPMQIGCDEAAIIKKSNKSDKISSGSVGGGRRDSQESSTTTQTSTSETNNTSSSSDDSSSSSSSGDDDDESSDSSSSSSSSSESVSSGGEPSASKKDRDKDCKEKGGLQSSSSASQENALATDKEVRQLIEMCLAGLEQCILRFPEHYKSVYRLAYFYFNNKSFDSRGSELCKQLLLGTYECRFHPNQRIQGLFAERKNQNFFNGIWRIPVQEIDRPGSFASHMSRCVSFLMQVLKDSGDSRMLTELCLQLRKVPDADKKYLRDNEREQLACQALTMCIQCLRNKIKLNHHHNNNNNHHQQQQQQQSATIGSHCEARLQVLLDIFHTYQIIKNIADYEGTSLPQVKRLLEEGYISYSGNLASSQPQASAGGGGGGLFDIARDFCRQQNRLMFKSKHKPASASSSNPSSNVSSAPAIFPTTTTPPLPLPLPLPPIAPSASSLTVTAVNAKVPAVGAPRKSQKAHGATGKPRGRPPMMDKSSNAASRTNLKSTTANESNQLANQSNNQQAASVPLGGGGGGGGGNPLLQNPFLRPEFIAAMFGTQLNPSVIDSAMQYFNNLNNNYGDAFNRLNNPLNYSSNPTTKPTTFNNPAAAGAAAANVPSDKAVSSSNNSMFGSIKAARPDVSITPVAKNPHQKFTQSGSKAKSGGGGGVGGRPNSEVAAVSQSRATTKPPEFSLLKASSSQAQQQQQQQRQPAEHGHGHLNQVALNLLAASEIKSSSGSSGRNSNLAYLPPTSQTSITPVKSRIATMPLNRAPMQQQQHPGQTSITPVQAKPTTSAPLSSSQPTTSLQHKLLSSKHHQHQPSSSYQSVITKTTSTRKEEQPKQPYFPHSSRKSALGNPTDMSLLSTSSNAALQSEIFKSLNAPPAYPMKKPMHSSKAPKRSIPNVNKLPAAAAYSTTMNSLTQDIGSFSHQKPNQDISISAAGYHPIKHHPAQDINNPAGFSLPNKKLLQDPSGISAAYSMKKPGLDISNPAGHSLKKSVQDVHNPAAVAAAYSMKKKLAEAHNLPGISSLKKAPAQDINSQSSNSVLNRLQQHSHLEIIPQSNRSRQVEPMNAPLEFSAVNNPPKAINFMNTDSVSVYELPKQKPNTGNPSSIPPAPRAEKEAAGSNVEIITLDD